jgi:hypothetical protein
LIMTEFTATSGVEIVINPAPWKDAKELKKAIERVVDLDTLGAMNGLASFIKAAVIVDSSDEVERALFQCLARCTRDGQKITEAMFDDVEARKDYYDIAEACIKENLSPLFVSLFSKLSALVGLKEQAKSDLK